MVCLLWTSAGETASMQRERERLCDEGLTRRQEARGWDSDEM